MEFLGRFVSENSIEMSETDIETAENWPLPKSSKDMELFLDSANYHWTVIRDFARIAVPLYCVMGKQ